jgi:hypothetical protein
MLLGEQVKPSKMIQSMIEVGAGICKDIKATSPGGFLGVAFY